MPRINLIFITLSKITLGDRFYLPLDRLMYSRSLNRNRVKIGLVTFAIKVPCPIYLQLEPLPATIISYLVINTLRLKRSCD